MNKIKIFNYNKTMFETIRQVHLDFHTPDFVSVGEKFNAVEFFDTLEESRINSITVFALCHHGNSYYHTKIGRVHPGLKKDLLGEMTEEAAKRKIQILAYFSMNVNEVQAAKHKDWHALDENKKSVNSQILQDGDELFWTWLCPNRGPLVEDFLLPHIGETLKNFKLDGIFIDMAGYIPGSCFCDKCIKGMKKLNLDPSNPVDHVTFNSITIQNFAKRLRKFMDSHEKGLRLEMGGFNEYGEAQKAKGIVSEFYLESLAYQTGWDYLPMAARYYRNFGMPTIGMTGRFLKNWGDFGTVASTRQLKTQLSMHLMAGLPNALGDHMPCTGKLDGAVYKSIGEAFRFIEERQLHCVGMEPGREAAVLVPRNTGGSAATMDAKKEKMKVKDSNAGICKMMSELHIQYDLITDDVDLSPFTILFVCHGNFGQDFLKRAEKFVSSGGMLVVSDFGMNCDNPELRKKWMKLIGIDSFSCSDYPGMFYESASEIFKNTDMPHMPNYVHEAAVDANFAKDMTILANAWMSPCIKQRGKHYGHFHGPAVISAGTAIGTKRHGKGCVITIRPQLFSAYYNTGYFAHRETLRAIIDKFLPESKRLIITDAPSFVELSYGTKNGKTVLQALPFITDKRARQSFESVNDSVSISGINVSIKAKAKSVLNPVTGKAIRFKNENGRVKLSIPAFSEHIVIHI